MGRVVDFCVDILFIDVFFKEVMQVNNGQVMYQYFMEGSVGFGVDCGGVLGWIVC